MIFTIPDYLKNCFAFFPEFIDSFVETGFFPFLFAVFGFFVIMIIVKNIGNS
ncbi:MAG: hypothetical protein MJ232_03085 [archaeon]|nr:hypothetical protein [archaeon]